MVDESVNENAMQRPHASLLNVTTADFGYNTEHGTATVTPGCFKVLRKAGYPINDVLTVAPAMDAADATDTASGHLLFKIETTSKPCDHPAYDAKTDTIKTWVCTCPAFYANLPGLDDLTTPRDIDPCDHVLALGDDTPESDDATGSDNTPAESTSTGV